jgi:hypothetical protein
VLSPAKKRTPADAEAELVATIAGFTHDPLGFVLYAFPWGEPGTALANFKGPDPWQVELLQAIGNGFLTPAQAIQIAVSSGHGIGKSAFLCWVVLWALATHEDTRGIVTAGTEAQLRTKTVPEIGKWFRMMICRHWFVQTTTRICAADQKHRDTWRVDFIPWNAENPEAFAGMHNQGKRILVVFDEASQIDDIIWETIEGALTDGDTEIIWLAFANPTRNSGRLKECFGRYRHRWITRQIDSRTVAITNKTQIQQWIDDYGEDSDFVRVRVRGLFPRAGAVQFIPGDRVAEAMKRDIETFAGDVTVIGVDVARHGDDQSVIAIRRGLDARSTEWVKLRVPDLMEIAARAAAVYRSTGAQAMFVDVGGMGWGVYDALKRMNIPGLFPVDFGSKADGAWVLDEPVKLANKRAEIWAAMKEWLKRGAIPNDPELEADLTSVEYGHTAMEEIQLEKKERMKGRGLASPDSADALACTFAAPVYAVKKAALNMAAGGGGFWSS